MDKLKQPSDLRDRISQLGMTQAGFARLMQSLGDHRNEKNILRSIQRMVSGDNRVSGEMRALIGLLETQRANRNGPDAAA